MLARLLPLLRHIALRRAVLAWFALAVGAATAAPLLQPQSMEMLCSASGAMKLLVKSSDGEEAPSTHSLPCALCVQALATPPDAPAQQPLRNDLAYAQQPLPAQRIAARTQPPLPARGPPQSSLV